MSDRFGFRSIRGLAVAGCLLALLPLSASSQQSSSKQPFASDPLAVAAADRSAFHEDWNSISLASSKLIPQDPLLGETDNVSKNSFVRELYQMQWRPYDPLDVYVIRPKGVAKPPAILYLYSYPSDTDRFKSDDWCTRATAGGYAAIGFVSALTGGRFHDRPMKEWFVSEFQESLSTSTHDVQMILNYLASRGDIDMSRIGMLGQGSGGGIAILAAAADPRIKALELLDPWGDWPAWLEQSDIIPADQRKKYATPEFTAKVASLDPVKFLPDLKTQHVLIEDVRGVAAMPVPCQEKMEAAAPPTALVNGYGDEMAFFRTASGGKVFDWIKAQLSPSADLAKLPAGDHHFFPAAGGTLQ